MNSVGGVILKRIIASISIILLLSSHGSIARAETGPAASGGPALVEVIETVSPSVVSILVIKRVPPSEPNEPSRVVVSSGSGFAIRSDGFVLSNAHVLDHAIAAEIHTHDGKVYPVDPENIWADPVSDIAIAKVNAEFVPLRWAAQASLRLGQEVFAMGAPYGLDFEGSASRGIISGFQRDLGADYAFIQHDAPINPGNSGGPLLNLKGEVVGVNARGILGGDGMGFAIPGDVASKIAATLISHGKVERAWLGLGLVDAVEADLGWPSSSTGPVITEIEPGGPAVNSGLQVGDTLLKVDGQSVFDLESVAQYLLKAAPGATVTLTYGRGGVERAAMITLGTRPHDADLYVPVSGLWTELTEAQVHRARQFGQRWSFLELAELHDAWVSYQGGGKARLLTEYLAVLELAWTRAQEGQSLKPEEAIAEAARRRGLLEVQVDLPTDFGVGAAPWAEWQDASGTVRAISLARDPAAPVGFQRLTVRFLSEHLETSGTALLILHLDQETERHFLFNLDQIH